MNIQKTVAGVATVLALSPIFADFAQARTVVAGVTYQDGVKYKDVPDGMRPMTLAEINEEIKDCGDDEKCAYFAKATRSSIQAAQKNHGYPSVVIFVPQLNP